MASLSQPEFFYLVLIGSGGMLLLVVGIATFITLYQKRILQEQERKRLLELEFQQKMIQTQLDTQEKDSIRIAADLHDSLGSLLWGAKLNAAFMGRSFEMEGEVKESYDALVDILDQSIHAVKRIAWELTPEAFHHSGLSQSLATLCARFNGKGLRVEFNEAGESFLWNDNRALSVYRIIQELVSNTIKHSEASRLEVDLFWTPGILFVKVSDNGKGFILTEKRGGVGWWNINHRSKQLKALIEIGDIPMGQGSEISLRIPLQHAK
ncbi:MAG: ATP-binding protein [Bacteroidota bacterium]